MGISTIPSHYEAQLMAFCSLVNKLKRLLVLTDAGVAASTDVSDLIADAYAALKTGTIEKFGPEVRIMVRALEQHIRLLEKLGLLSTAIVAALTTVNTAAAATDLRHVAAVVIQINGFDRTREDYFDETFAYAVTG